MYIILRWKYDLTRLECKISNEYDNFLLYYDQWHDLKSNNAPISERFQFSSMDEILQIAMKNKALDLIENTTEISKLLGIVSETEKLFRKFYSPYAPQQDLELDIPSIRNKFIANSVDRIKFDTNTIIRNQIGNDTLYYVLEGNTYQGRQNLQRFSQNIVYSQKMLSLKGQSLPLPKVIEIVKDSEQLLAQSAENHNILKKNDLITAPHRFNIIYCLYWTDLKKTLKMTSGNLDYHLSILQKKGWILKYEEYKDRMLQFIDISDYGRSKFKKFTEKISSMCEQVMD